MSVEIEVTTLSYSQLCDLGKQVENRKSKFIALDDLYVVEGKEPCLCYMSRYGGGTNPFYSDYWSNFRNIFNDTHAGRFRELSKFRTYLVRYGVTTEVTHNTKEDLLELWNPIKVSLATEAYDAEIAKLQADRAEVAHT